MMFERLEKTLDDVLAQPDVRAALSAPVRQVASSRKRAAA